MQPGTLETLWQDIKSTLPIEKDAPVIPCAWLCPTLVSQETKSTSGSSNAFTANNRVLERKRYSIEYLQQCSTCHIPEQQLGVSVLNDSKKRKRGDYASLIESSSVCTVTKEEPNKVQRERQCGREGESRDLHSEDIVVKGKSSSLTFKDMFLEDGLMDGLKICGFEKPSPVQVASIPYARLGCDLIIQAKSGTGKTCVYAVTILQSILDNQKNKVLSSSVASVQAIVMVPTRELASQVAMVLAQLKKGIESETRHVNIVTCVGGTSLKQDCHALSKGLDVVIGTPGRIRSLVDSGVLHLEHLQILVMDEADKLLESCFYKDITVVENYLPNWKQVLAFSATFSPSVLSKLHRIMKEPRKVTVLEETLVEKVSPDTYSSPLYAETSLAGITHYKAEIQPFRGDVFHVQLETLIAIFGEFSFHQCLVFSNDKTMLDRYCYGLRNAGFSADFTSGDLNQSTRNEIFQRFYANQTQILFTTDLLARGIDFVDCNLVVNLDIPRTVETYLHRAGRAGRFGRFGNCVTVYSSITVSEMERLESQLGLKLQYLQIEISMDEEEDKDESDIIRAHVEDTCADHYSEPTQVHNMKTEEIGTANNQETDMDSNYFYWKGYWYGYFLSQWYLWNGQTTPPPLEQVLQQHYY